MPLAPRTGLRVRLVFLLALMILPVTGLLLYNAIEARKVEALHAQTVALRLARLVMLEQRELIDGARQLLPSLAQLASVQNPAATAACNRELARLLEQYPYYANFGVSGRDGIMRCSGLPMPAPVPIHDRDYFRHALTTGELAIGSYQVGRVTGKSAINLGYPLRDAQGRITGVIFAALDLAWLSRKLTAVSLPEGTSITIFDTRGTVLAHLPDPGAWFGKSKGEVPFVRHILERGAEGTAESVDANGARRLYAFTPLHQQGDGGSAYVSVGIPLSIAYGEVDARYQRNLLALLLIVIAVLGAGWIGSHVFVLRPLQHLARDSERLGKGDLSTRTGANQHSREFQQLAQTFNQMAASLQQRQQEVDANEQELRRINRALQTLSAGNHALVRATDEAALLQEMCRVAVELGGYRIAWVGSAEHHTQKPVRMLAQAGADSRFFDDMTISWDDTAYGYGPTGTAIRTGKPCVAHGMQSEPRYRAWHAICRAQGIDSAVSFPLYVNNEILGAFTLYSEDH
ncbi:MAG: GAF domain-containing protein, partial [Gammaproteobacteria bacterium]